MGNTIEVLWTGGWDSTFRVLYASLIEEKEVRPHYIADLARKSTLRELKAISDVRRELEKIDKNAAERIKELTITPITEIESFEDITQSYVRLKKQAHLGSQYDWLSRYARMKNIDCLELSVHVDDKAYYFLEGKVEQKDHGGWKLKSDVTGDTQIFSCFEFPLLQISKTEMRAKAKELGFIEALEKSWFCFNPVGNAPCGTCSPCIYAVEEGMGYRLTKSGILRYKTRYLRKAARLPVRVSRKVYSKLKS
ncbi:7-cyano-7-deazaguanine synthase [Halomonas sp. M20]|uniref:7-cyano-7-deazaguanine synthase n=1 Tax=Halomonas sp. M20 TaxID=2763264 RepID=UPI001D0AD290|nr:7-cyano-7-deazaguanine synthase [Halomonas sp. M20]